MLKSGSFSSSAGNEDVVDDECEDDETNAGMVRVESAETEDEMEDARPCGENGCWDGRWNVC